MDRAQFRRRLGGLQHRRRLLARWVALAAAFHVLGCGAGASFQALYAQPGYVPPERVNVQVRNRTGAWDLNDRLDEIYSRLRDELARYGIRASRVRGADPPAPPALMIVVESWEPGNPRLRAICGHYGCGEGEMVVYFDLRNPDVQVWGRVRGWLRTGPSGENSVKPGEEAAGVVACAVKHGPNARRKRCRSRNARQRSTRATRQLVRLELA